MFDVHSSETTRGGEAWGIPVRVCRENLRIGALVWTFGGRSKEEGLAPDWVLSGSGDNSAIVADTVSQLGPRRAQLRPSLVERGQ